MAGVCAGAPDDTSPSVEMSSHEGATRLDAHAPARPTNDRGCRLLVFGWNCADADCLPPRDGTEKGCGWLRSSGGPGGRLPPRHMVVRRANVCPTIGLT